MYHIRCIILQVRYIVNCQEQAIVSETYWQFIYSVNILHIIHNILYHLLVLFILLFIIILIYLNFLLWQLRYILSRIREYIRILSKDITHTLLSGIRKRTPYSSTYPFRLEGPIPLGPPA